MDSENRSGSLEQEIFAYVSKWLATSGERHAGKIAKWRLLEDLYFNRRDLNSWGPGRFSSREGEGSAATRDERWQSDIVLSPSYIVDSWADRAYQAIFGGSEWLTLTSEAQRADAPRPGDDEYPLSVKVQELLLSRLTRGRIHEAMYGALQHLALYGSVYAKVSWAARHGGIAGETLDPAAPRNCLCEYPLLQVIPLEGLRVDWTATHCDVQRHTGIGHKTRKSRAYVLERFHEGVFHLNRDAFLRRWPEEESRFDEGPGTVIALWEWHGTAFLDDGPCELVCVIASDEDAETPEDGVMVRCVPGPILEAGLRPFVAAQFTPVAGPFGVGAVEGNLDLIHAISQFISQSQDNARLTANAQLIVRRGSSAARQVTAEDDAVYPGKVWLVDDPDDIRPFPSLNFPQDHVNGLIGYLNDLLEKRTTVTEFTMGMPGGARTATEAHILQEASSAPFAVRADLFARTFLEPFGRIAVEMMRQFLMDDRTITVKDGRGLEKPSLITSEELRHARFTAHATLTQRDSTRIAKAQSIERALPMLAKFRPLLEAEGIAVSFSELLKRYLDLLGIEAADRVFTRRAVRHPGMRLEDGPMEEPEEPDRLVEDGGPLGPEPTEVNILAQFLQKAAMAKES
jgi:hypothetical protein